MEGNADRIVGRDVLGQTVYRRLGRILFCEGPKESIPDNQRSAVISVKVSHIRSMMSTMMRRRVQDPFERAHRAHQFRVDPELIEQADRLQGHDHDWRKAN